MYGIDIPPVEAAATACAIIFPAARWARGLCGWCVKPHILMLFLDLLRGAAFFPFILLIAGAFSKTILLFIVDSNRLTLFMAGLIGAVSVFKSDRWMIEYIKDNGAKL
jgi:hypothetical protein